MFTLYGGSGKGWSEMTPTEQKVCLIIVGVLVLGLIAYGIYNFFKNRKKKC